MSRSYRRPACLVAAGVLFGLAGWLHFNRGLTVRIHNSDARTLRSLVVSVTGQAYPLGDLPPGSTVSVRVEPKGESGVAVEFQESAGNPKQLNAGGYYEWGYKGTVSLDIDAERILHKTENVSSYPP